MAKKPTKKPQRPPEPEPKTVQKARPALPEPAISPPKTAPEPAPLPRTPALPLPPTPPKPVDQRLLPFSWKKERPKTHACFGCGQDTKLSTKLDGNMDTFEPKDGEGLFMEWFEDMIVLVTCPMCFRRGFGKTW